MCHAEAYPNLKLYHTKDLVRVQFLRRSDPRPQDLYLTHRRIRKPHLSTVKIINISFSNPLIVHHDANLTRYR